MEDRVKRRNKNGYRSRDIANSENTKRGKRAIRVTEKERDRERKMDAMVESFLKLQRLRVLLSLFLVLSACFGAVRPFTHLPALRAN